MNDYPADWKNGVIPKRIKDRAGWKCVRCDHLHDSAGGYMLGVHHLDLDKANCEWWNLPALCQRCHLVIQAKVKMGQMVLFPGLHSEWFKPYLAGRMQARSGNTTKEAWVRDNYEDVLLSHEVRVTK